MYRCITDKFTDKFTDNFTDKFTDKFSDTPLPDLNLSSAGISTAPLLHFILNSPQKARLLDF